MDKETIEIKRCMDAVAATKEGRAVLRYLRDKCGQLRPSVVLGDLHEISTLATIHNEAQRSVWLCMIYPLLTKERLREIEYPTGDEIESWQSKDKQTQATPAEQQEPQETEVSEEAMELSLEQIQRRKTRRLPQRQQRMGDQNQGS